MIRVAVFEDNKHLLETFQLLLDASEGFACTGAWPNGKNIIPNLAAIDCDVVLMDIEMPGLNGIALTKVIKAQFPEKHIIIQTVFFNDSYIFEAICAGASGYLLKSTTPEGYIEAIKEVCLGGSPMSPGIARKVLELFKNNLNPGTQQKNYNLTPQEKKVLELLTSGKSYKMIATELFISNDTVKSHVRNIYIKLQVHSGTEAVSLALREKIV